jgi:hypothetical protein
LLCSDRHAYAHTAACSTRTHTCPLGHGPGTVSGFPACGCFHCSERQGTLASLKPLQWIPVTLALLQLPPHVKSLLRLSFELGLPGVRGPQPGRAGVRPRGSPSRPHLVSPALSARPRRVAFLFSPAGRTVRRRRRRRRISLPVSISAARDFSPGPGRGEKGARGRRPGGPDGPLASPPVASRRRPAPGSLLPRAKRPRRLWRRRPACIRARGGSAPPCCRGTSPACAACQLPGRAASRPRRRPPHGPRPPDSWRRPRWPRAPRARVPEQVSECAAVPADAMDGDRAASRSARGAPLPSLPPVCAPPLHCRSWRWQHVCRGSQLSPGSRLALVHLKIRPPRTRRGSVAYALPSAMRGLELSTQLSCFSLHEPPKAIFRR